MGQSKLINDEFTVAEIERRRDELAKRMLSMPPQPLKPDHKTKTKPDASPEKRGRLPKNKG